MKDGTISARSGKMALFCALTTTLLFDATAAHAEFYDKHRAHTLQGRNRSGIVFASGRDGNVRSAGNLTVFGVPPASAASRAAVPRAKVAPLVATYTIKDIGAPPATYSSFTQPFGFNGTGQLVGNARLVAFPGSQYQQCIAWTGTAWVDFEGTTSLNCYATSGVSDANAQGVFAAVGETNVATTNNLVAYYAVISPTSATLTPFTSNAPSILYTMNASGLAAGLSYYAPFGGFSSTQPTVTSTGTALTLLQPTCTTAKTGCALYPYYYASVNGQSRSITAGGTVLAYALNGTLGQYIEYKGGTSPTSVQFSLPLDGGNGAAGVRGMDDSGAVVYYQFNSAAGKYLTRTYSPSTKIARNLGTLPGNSCTQYLPLYINGPGRVLGLTQACSFPSDQTYWTWDAAHGMVAISFSHSGYSTVSLYFINDKNQIAGDFYTTARAHHWGYLLPPF